MKIKNLLIFALFISFNYSVCSEEINKENQYNLHKDILEMRKKSLKYHSEIIGLCRTLSEIEERERKINSKNLRQSEKDYTNAFRCFQVMGNINEQIEQIYVIIYYENLFRVQNLNKNNAGILINEHEEFRNKRFYVTKKLISDYRNNLKKQKTGIQNVSAVVCVNNYLDVIEELVKWIQINEKYDEKYFLEN